MACAHLGVTPRWLPFGSVDFERHGDDDDVWEAVRARVEGADVVLVPGSPLTHPDHAWLNGLLARVPRRLVGLYAEQPYTLAGVRHAVRARRRRRARPPREMARDPRVPLAASAPRDAAQPPPRAARRRARGREGRLAVGLSSLRLR